MVELGSYSAVSYLEVGASVVSVRPDLTDNFIGCENHSDA